tara:strand:- start:27 stop:203 length:177 start_codon:yes stop_codon:yes gene_type:complete
MKEINHIDYSKINDDMMEKIIQSLYMFKKLNPKNDVYFNEKSIMMVLKMGSKMNKEEM